MGINRMKKTAEGEGRIKSKIKAIFRPKQQKHKNGQNNIKITEALKCV